MRLLMDMHRKLRCWVILAAIALVCTASLRAERLGDNFQIVLPVLALGCQAANGKGAEYMLRYAVLFTGIHGTKRLLGDAPINVRPSGSLQGMPSGHTATAVFGASTLINECVGGNLWLRTAVIVAAGFTGASRIEAGAHTIWQVLAGVLWGLACDRVLRRNQKGRAMVQGFFRRIRRGAVGAARVTALRLRGAGPACIALALLTATVTGARAETVIFGYSGWQTAPHSTVRLNGDRFNAGWKGDSLSTPPYWGLRVTRWNGDIGWGAEITHAKIYADDKTLARAGVGRLEFSDGLNIVTVNMQRRWQRAGWTPYLGIGLGAAVPHVEVGEGEGRTFEYQLTGPALRLFAGAAWDLSERWQIMAEYQGTYSSHDADLKGGGSLKTDVITNAVNIGLGWKF